MFTALLSISFYGLLESLKNLYKKHKNKINKPMNQSINIYATPKKNKCFASKIEERESLLKVPDSSAKNRSKNSPNFSISRLLGESQYIEEIVEYKTKIKSDFKDILFMMKNPQLQLLLLVVTLENITPEISCIFFYYFIEILKFSFFDVNSVFVFASLGFLISLTILNFEFIESSFENFYKVTSFLLAIAYYLNLR